ncbi:CheR family methyltransferase [Roseateles cellulosilyticus]|uniref:histidine kinase n=1 Tax=Pelomonas cellulosilytica TaxID=2906762 RepID=A0ABS8XMI4_9BURK|nr:CheR family methyltransferase [Pelomonas sp. P8]MCE4553984.1 ATP-binding protein [Pelomonas sp. P8]
MQQDQEPVKVAVLGGSAGSMDAFAAVLSGLSERPGFAVLVICHLDPTQESQLDGILKRHTAMPVERLAHIRKIEHDRVYVLPEDATLTALDGHFRITKRAPGPHMPIDICLASMAQDPDVQAAAVILSGIGSDGASGIVDLKAGGALVLVQAPATASHDGMPVAAINTGLVDAVLAPKDIATRLLEGFGNAAADTDADHVDDLTAALALVQERTGTNLGYVKDVNLRRRFLRRVMLKKDRDVPAYLQQLRADPREAEALRDDILIGVTAFFRDPEFVDVLRLTVIPKLIELRRDPIRVWVPACSTGEEAYTIAILLREALDAGGLDTKVQIFGTDINEVSIETARTALYPAAAVENVPPAYVAKGFVQTAGHYAIRKDIRTMCVFARHNLMTHAPFLGMDLISCRNMLIYLRKEAQEHVMGVLHYAVRQDGHVLLGRAEAASAAQGFEHAGAPHLYRKMADGKRSRRHWPAEAMLPWAGPRDDSGGRAKVQTDHVDAAVTHCALDRYAPPGFAVNDAGDVVQFRGDVSGFIAPVTGEATLSLARLLRPELNVPVRTALLEAKQSGGPVRRERVVVDERVYALEALPFTVGTESRHFLVTLAEQRDGALTLESALTGQGNRESELERTVVTLSAELDSAQAQLRTMVMEFESANEELRTSNEEMLSANEEMQSANEELQSAKQELESTNQELHSLNEEMKVRNDQLAVANDDLGNLVEGLPLAVLLLDRQLRLRHFTPQAAELFDLQPGSVGQAMPTLNSRFAIADIERMVDVAVKDLAATKTEYRDASGHWWLVNVRAYRTSDDRIDGAVIVFEDIDDLKSAVSRADTARAEAEQANTAKDEFLALVSHELRAPLNVISGWASVLERTQADATDSVERKAIATILRQCRSQAQLIDDLLDASRITSGRFAIDKHPVDLGEAVLAVLESMLPAAKARELTLTGSGLRLGHRVSGDARRLQQIVSNIVSNAIKFTPPGGRIEVALTRLGGLLELSVADTGIGVADEHLPHIFERFMQANMGRTREHGGLGLGLAIVKHLVQAHGGTVTALSEGLGKGLRVLMRFPALDEPAVLARPQPVAGPVGGALRLEVLVVDDDAESREALGELLGLVGSRVVTAASVSEALAVLDRHSFDAIVSDLAMPGQDGFELMRSVRSREMRDGRPRSYAIALSGLSSLQDRDMALAAGFDEHASKPVDAEALIGWLGVARDRVRQP